MRNRPSFLDSGSNMDNLLYFYEVNSDYITYLLSVDSKVPYLDYSSTNEYDKFLCGIVLSVGGHDYFAPITSFKTPQRTRGYASRWNARCGGFAPKSTRMINGKRILCRLPFSPRLGAMGLIRKSVLRLWFPLLNDEARSCAPPMPDYRLICQATGFA